MFTRRLLSILFAIIIGLSVAFVAGTVQPDSAKAYYGETEGIVNFVLSAPGRGCYGTVAVVTYRSVQVQCIIKNYNGSAYITLGGPWLYGNDPSGLQYFDFYIPNHLSDWRPAYLRTMKADSYGGLHSIIMNYGTR